VGEEPARSARRGASPPSARGLRLVRQVVCTGLLRRHNHWLEGAKGPDRSVRKRKRPQGKRATRVQRTRARDSSEAYGGTGSRVERRGYPGPPGTEGSVTGRGQAKHEVVRMLAFAVLSGRCLLTGRKWENAEVSLDRFLSGTHGRRGRFGAATHTVNRTTTQSPAPLWSSGGRLPYPGQAGPFRGGLFGTRHGARQRCAQQRAGT
jgi:hypothetical protein